MKGKLVNSLIGILNIILGIVLMIVSLVLPTNISEITIQEESVIHTIRFAFTVQLCVYLLLNFIFYLVHRNDERFKLSFSLSLFAISYFFIPETWIAIFPIISGIRILKVIRKENFIELNSMFMIFFIIFLYITLSATVISSAIYPNIANQVKNSQNENEQAYKDDFFKYITPLGIEDEYINVKVGDKFGYINPRGETVIDFQYDYASQFIKVNLFDKEFEIALVCEKGSTKIIMKNQRVVMSYKTESNNRNYEAKQKELNEVYHRITGKTTDAILEIEPKKAVMRQLNVYREQNTEDYTYKYDYNETYDIIVTESSIGLNNRYELVQKANPNMRIVLDCEYLSYDENYLYIYTNGNIPFYNPSTKEQGWFDQFGKKQSMSGNAQILEMYEDKILIKNYNNQTIYFINYDGQIVSPVYQDIYILSDQYIIKDENQKYRFIDSQFNPLYDYEYDYMLNSLESANLMIGFHLPEKIEVDDFGHTNIVYDVIDLEGNRIAQNIEYIFDISPKIENAKSKTQEEMKKEILEQMDVVKNKFVGDEFYQNR